jgi:hypothetical protein
LGAAEVWDRLKTLRNARAPTERSRKYLIYSGRLFLILFWASLINLEFAAAFILSIESLDCRVPFRNTSHRHEPKTARLGLNPTTLSPAAK